MLRPGQVPCGVEDFKRIRLEGRCCSDWRFSARLEEVPAAELR